MNVTIRYFAVLREIAGKDEEQVELAPGGTAADAYAVLAGKYDFPLGRDRLRVAIDDVFATFDEPLHGGETIVFLPPMAGG